MSALPAHFIATRNCTRCVREFEPGIFGTALVQNVMARLGLVGSPASARLCTTCLHAWTSVTDRILRERRIRTLPSDVYEAELLKFERGQLREGALVKKQCNTCGYLHDDFSWVTLKRLSVTGRAEGEPIELRNCHCGSTLGLYMETAT